MSLLSMYLTSLSHIFLIFLFEVSSNRSWQWLVWCRASLHNLFLTPMPLEVVSKSEHPVCKYYHNYGSQSQGTSQWGNKRPALLTITSLHSCGNRGSMRFCYNRSFRLLLKCKKSKYRNQTLHANIMVISWKDCSASLRFSGYSEYFGKVRVLHALPVVVQMPHRNHFSQVLQASFAFISSSRQLNYVYRIRKLHVDRFSLDNISPGEQITKIHGCCAKTEKTIRFFSHKLQLDFYTICSLNVGLWHCSQVHSWDDNEIENIRKFIEKLSVSVTFHNRWHFSEISFLTQWKLYREILAP